MASTLTGTRAASTFPVAGNGEGGTKKQAYGTYYVSAASNLNTSNVIELCRVPKGAVVTGGRFFGLKVDTSASPALDMDIGYADDTDAFGNLGTLSYAAVTGVKPEATGFSYPLAGVLMTSGPLSLTEETVIQAIVNVSVKKFTSGSIGVVVDYLMP